MLVSAQTCPGTSSASQALVLCLTLPLPRFISLNPGLSDRAEHLSVSLLIPLNLLHLFQTPRRQADQGMGQFLTVQFIECSTAIRWLLLVTCLRCSWFNNPSRHMLRKEDQHTKGR